MAQARSRLHELLFVSSRRFANDQEPLKEPFKEPFKEPLKKPLKTLFFCIAGEPAEHRLNLAATVQPRRYGSISPLRLNLAATVWNLPVELLASALRWIGMISVKSV